jgi:Tol biopolymer transport system component
LQPKVIRCLGLIFVMFALATMEVWAGDTPQSNAAAEITTKKAEVLEPSGQPDKKRTDQTELDSTEAESKELGSEEEDEASRREDAPAPAELDSAEEPEQVAETSSVDGESPEELTEEHTTGQANLSEDSEVKESPEGEKPEGDQTEEVVAKTDMQEEPVEEDLFQPEVIEMKPAGIEPLRVQALTAMEFGANDSNPSWSPSGELLAFERSTNDRREIIICRKDGTVIQRIYFRPVSEAEEMNVLFPGVFDEVSYNAGITWSPDEKSLVFMSNGGRGNYDLYLIPELGKGTTIRLTENSEKDSHPHWSPVANELVFVSGRTGKADLYLLKLETKETIKLTRGMKSYLYPQWSPDGKKIVMIYGSNDNHDVFLMEDVSRPMETLRPLTSWAYDDLRPIWSPDGKKVAFYTNYNTENDPKVWSIGVIGVDGSGQWDFDNLADKIVATNVVPDIERGPTWMPDSKRIIYVKKDEHAFDPIHIADIETKTNFAINTGTKMNHDVVCSLHGILAYRAQVEQWDRIYVAELKE